MKGRIARYLLVQKLFPSSTVPIPFNTDILAIVACALVKANFETKIPTEVGVLVLSIDEVIKSKSGFIYNWRWDNIVWLGK